MTLQQQQVGYISYVNNLTDFLSPERAKVAVLWFDELLVGGPLSSRLDVTVDLLRSEEPFSDGTRSALLSCLRPADITLWSDPRRVGTTWQSAPEPLKDLVLSSVQEHLQVQGPLGQDEYKYAMYILFELETWHQHFRDLVYLGNRVEGSVIRTSVISYGQEWEVSDLILQDFPDFGLLSWDEIVEVKRSPLFSQFKERVTELATLPSNAQPAERLSLNRAYERELHDLVRELRPSIGSTVLESIATNIPSPVSSLVGLYTAGRDVYEAWDINKRYAWVFFLIDLRNKVQSRIGTTH